MVIFSIKRRGIVQKIKKKKKKKNFVRTFFLAVFLFPVIKKGGKSMWLCFFSVRGEGKCEINYKKKKFFSALGSFFDHFWSFLSRKR